MPNYEYKVFYYIERRIARSVSVDMLQLVKASAACIGLYKLLNFVFAGARPKPES